MTTVTFGRRGQDFDGAGNQETGNLRPVLQLLFGHTKKYK